MSLLYSKTYNNIMYALESKCARRCSGQYAKQAMLVLTVTCTNLVLNSEAGMKIYVRKYRDMTKTKRNRRKIKSILWHTVCNMSPMRHSSAYRHCQQRPQGGTLESDQEQLVSACQCGIHFLTDQLKISVPTAPRHQQHTGHKPTELFFSSRQLRSK